MDRVPLRLAAPAVVTERRGAALWISSQHALPTAARCLGDMLVHHAARAPRRTWLAERALAGGWRTVSYAEGLRAAQGIGSALLALGASRARPVMVLAENGVDHALVQLGAMHAGVPVAPVSAAFALLSADFARLREVTELLHPRVIFVPDARRYGRALDALALRDVEVVTSPALAELARTPPSAALNEAFAAVGPDTVAKVLFTSGSTGSPRGIVNNQRMLCSNQEAITALWPFLEDEPPVTVDWLPWSHTFGGNHNFNMVLRHGGSLYIDGGKPAPGLIDETVRNLREVSPTMYFNVPRGFDLLLPFLEDDADLRARFFARLKLVFYAAAALPPGTRARLERVAEAAGRGDLFLTSAWGATETAPLATSAHFPTATPAIIGLPAPGTTIALVPVDDLLELRVRGPNVTPGRWAPGGEILPLPVDEHGFLPSGDAGRLVDPGRPEAGLLFEGRIGENFKLSSGTWVAVGALRVALLDAAAPLLSDLVVAGHDRDALGVLLFRAPAASDPAQLRGRLIEALRGHNARNPSASHTIRRALVLAEPPSLDAGEITDKGYINQRRVLTRRAALVERLFAEPPDGEVIVVE